MTETASMPVQAIENLYVALAKSLSRLPNFRGKVRAGLALHRLLGLRGRHVVTDALLRRPLKFQMRLDLQCAHERMALLMGGYEAETSKFLARCYPGRGYVLDVGANIGLIAIPLALALREKDPTAAQIVHCVEPIKSNCDALRHNIQLNDLGRNVSLLECCLGESERTAEMVVEGNLPSGQGTGTAILIATGSTYVCERIAVQLTTIDALVSAGRLPRDCALIKLDCDGYDFNVLRGARTLLTDARPVVFGEFHAYCLNWHGQTHAEAVQFMNEFDYASFQPSSAGGHRFVPFTPEPGVEQDLLFIPRESLGRFGWCVDTAACL